MIWESLVSLHRQCENQINHFSQRQRPIALRFGAVFALLVSCYISVAPYVNPVEIFDFAVEFYGQRSISISHA